MIYTLACIGASIPVLIFALGLIQFMLEFPESILPIGIALWALCSVIYLSLH